MHGRGAAGGGPEGETDGAERAFAVLREEVAALRREIELVSRQVQQSGPAGQAPAMPDAPDYSPTLGAMAKELKAISGWLATLERAPAMTMTPASYEAEIGAMAQNAATVVSRPFVATLDQAREMTRALEALAGRVHDRREQRQWLWTVGMLGVMGGVLLWVMLIALLPFGGGDWLAALPLGGRWIGGQTLMREAEPATWNRMVRLYKACPQDRTTALCEAALAVRTISPRQGSAKNGSPVNLPSPPLPRSQAGAGQ